MLEVFKDELPGGLSWRTFYKYDTNGRLILIAYPSAVTGHDETKADLLDAVSGNYVHMLDNSGLLKGLNYTVAPDVAVGYLSLVYFQKGEQPGVTPVKDLLVDYFYTARTGDSGTTYSLQAIREYANFDLYSTTFSYTWYGTTNAIQLTDIMLPYVHWASDGAHEYVQQDVFGRGTWFKDGEGFLHYTEYEQGPGAIKKSIVDVNSSLTGDFLNLPFGWTTPAGGGLHLKTTRTIEPLGRPTQVTDPKGNITHVVYKDTNWEVRVYPGWNTGTPTGPTQVSRQDKPGSYLETLTTSATPTTSGGIPTGLESIVTSTLQMLFRSYLDNGDRPSYRDAYYSFTGLTYSPSVNIGTLNTHYNRTEFGYDEQGNPNRTKDGMGSISRTVYDRLNRSVSTWVGTNDTPASGEWSPTNNTPPSNMQLTSQNQYDFNGIGNSTLTFSAAFVTDSDLYVTERRYDYRNRMTDLHGPDNVGIKYQYDNRDQVKVEEVYADYGTPFIIDPGELRGKQESEFDARNRRVFLKTYEVDPVTGALGDRIETRFSHNPRDLWIKTASTTAVPRWFSKAAYDGAGRLVGEYTCFEDLESWQTISVELDGDTVIEQRKFIYDAASNQVTASTFLRRDDDSTSLGELAANNAYLSVQVSWYDKANRLTHTANYGRDNGAVRYIWNTSGVLIDSDADGIPNEAENAAREPNTSDDYIVSKLEYDSAGFQFKTTDNLSRFTQRTYDRTGQVLTSIENYVNGAVGNSEWSSDRWTEYFYTNGLRVNTIRAKNAKGGSVQNQDTKYLYESTINPWWSTSIIYPDSADTTSAGTDQEKFIYDRLGRKVDFTDQRGVQHFLGYDFAGRFTMDMATVTSGVDGSVLRIDRVYDDLSRLKRVTSSSDIYGLAVVNEIELTYTPWTHVGRSEQSHNGPVTGSMPAVQYTYTDGGPGTGDASYVRLTSMVYPGGPRTVHFNYPAVGTIGDHLSRIDNLAEDASGTTKYTQYTHIGASSLVKLAYPAVTNGLNLDFGAASGGVYAGIDRFGRIADQKWQNNAGTTFHDRYAYTYDRMGNRKTRDLLATQQPATAKDWAYVYDGLDRVTQANQGSLTGTPPNITQAAANFNQEWLHLEPVGNWKRFRWDSNGGGNSWTTQNRTHNSANEIDVDNNDANAAGASITGTNANWVDPTYDKAGSLKSGPKVGDEATSASRQHYTYDAWNRLVKVQADSGGAPGATIVEFQYDGLHRRIVKLKPNGANWDRMDYYYNENWQCLEERFLANTASKTTVATAVKLQYVWDLRYVDALAVRYRDADGNGSLEEKLYFCQDASSNVTALVSTSGTVLERYSYDPYGKVAIYDAAWTTRSTSSYANEILYAGYRQDPETLVYHVRHRYYHPTLGRWVQRDLVGYHDGMNLYEYCQSTPMVLIDPLGLACGPGDETDMKVTKKVPASKISAPPPKPGLAPIGDDGYPIELHHCQQQEAKVHEFTRTDHRLGDNFAKNHSNTGQTASDVEHGSDWKKFKRAHWKKQWVKFESGERAPAAPPPDAPKGKGGKCGGALKAGLVTVLVAIPASLSQGAKPEEVPGHVVATIIQGITDPIPGVDGICSLYAPVVRWHPGWTKTSCCCFTARTSYQRGLDARGVSPGGGNFGNSFALQFDDLPGGTRCEDYCKARGFYSGYPGKCSLEAIEGHKRWKRFETLGR